MTALFYAGLPPFLSWLLPWRRAQTPFAATPAVPSTPTLAQQFAWARNQIKRNLQAQAVHTHSHKLPVQACPLQLRSV
jgi:hypothetical protein